MGKPSAVRPSRKTVNACPPFVNAFRNAVLNPRRGISRNFLVRHLKKLSGREARFKRNTNHAISKRIVQKAKANGQALAIEDLRHIRSRTEARLRKSQRSRHSS